MTVNDLLTEDEILEVMEPDAWYTIPDLAQLLDTKVKNLHRCLKDLEREDKINIRDYNSRKMVQIKPRNSIAGPSYLAPLKPLTGYDPGQLMRMCQGSRKPETGMT